MTAWGIFVEVCQVASIPLACWFGHWAGQRVGRANVCSDLLENKNLSNREQQVRTILVVEGEFNASMRRTQAILDVAAAPE